MTATADGRPRYTAQFAARGIAVIEHALDERDLEQMTAAFARASPRGGARQGDIADDLIVSLATHGRLSHLAQQLAGAPARLVRLIAFDKSPAANWFVPWHQDRSIAVAHRVDLPGYDHWTVKHGCAQVEPPVSVLTGMVALRVHLDDCTEDDGPLEVLPGSHLFGRLTRDDVARHAASHPPLLCLANRGDILAMRPLLIHRSQKARVPSHRRVLHLEYATAALADGLSWALC